MKNYTAGPGDVPVLQAAATKMLHLYPDIPALGSPFGTGNDLFGLDSQYKRLAAISESMLPAQSLWSSDVKTKMVTFFSNPYGVDGQTRQLYTTSRTLDTCSQIGLHQS